MSLRALSSFFFRKPSRVLAEINANAALLVWCKEHSTANVFRTYRDFYRHINTEVLDSEPIDFLEFGVYKGTSLFSWAAINNNEKSRFFGFDSFEGLPEDWFHARRTVRKGHFDTSGRVPETSDSRIRFVKGLFQETLPSFLRTFTPHNRLVIHNDSDLYSSTLYCLTQLDPILTPASVLIFDELFSATHEFRALLDYVQAYRRDYTVLAAMGANPYLRVALTMQ